MRLDKFLVLNGFGSRKEVKSLCKKGRVHVNQVIQKQSDVHIDEANDIVSVDHIEIQFTKQVYWMMNKPQGYECTHESLKYPSVLELVHETRSDLLFVGRLDVDTEGLLLITNDGSFVHHIAHGKNEIMKTYRVGLLKPFDLSYITQLEAGIELHDGITKPAVVQVLDAHTIELSIAEGRYHQVKRMMHACDNEVIHLKRISIGTLKLDAALTHGAYRPLTDLEIESLGY